MEYNIKSKTSLRQILGKASEQAVKEEFMSKEYKICKCVKQGKKGKSGWFVYVNESEIQEILTDYQGDKNKLLEFLKRNVNGLPDFLVLDKDSLFFLEVKSSKPETKPIFSDKQLETFELLEKEGYNVRWYHMTIRTIQR